MQDKHYTSGSPENPLRGPGWPFQITSEGVRIKAEIIALEGGRFDGDLAVPTSYGNTIVSQFRPAVILDDPSLPAVLRLGVRGEDETTAELRIHLAPVSFERSLFTTRVGAKGATVRWDQATQQYQLFAPPGATFTLEVDPPEGARVEEVFYQIGWNVPKRKYAPRTPDNQHLQLGASFMVPAAELLQQRPLITFELRQDEGDWTARSATLEILLIPKAAPESAPAASISAEGISLIKAGLAKLEGN